MSVRRRLTVLVAATVLSAGLAACGDDDDDTAAEPAGGDETTTTVPTAVTAGDTAPAPTEATAPAPAVVFTAVLNGSEEVPGPGLADGRGGAELTFGGGQVCYVLNVAMGDAPTATHIHQAAKGAAGDVVVDLKPAFQLGEATHDATGCAKPDQAVLDSIVANPAGFYVNVHSAEFPGGAVRGQLAAKA